MNKSLLVALAIMPTLLVGCKKDTKLQSIAFDQDMVVFTSKMNAADVELDPKPSSIKIKFDDIKWTATLNDKDCSDELQKKYVKLEVSAYPVKEKGGIMINFGRGTKISEIGADALKVTATYKDKSALIEVRYSATAN